MRTALSTRPEISKAKLSDSASLDWLLEDMRAYGLPRVSMPDKDGWFASIKMHTNALGAEFSIQSDFKHPTPISAIRQCYDRMKLALATIKEAK